MSNNLINLVAKLYAGFIAVMTMVYLVRDGGTVEASDLGLIAGIGMMVGFGVIMIGELYLEMKQYYRKNKVIKESKKAIKEMKEEKKQEEVAQ